MVKKVTITENKVREAWLEIGKAKHRRDSYVQFFGVLMLVSDAERIADFFHDMFKANEEE
jgi:hypothetical protein